MIRSLIKHIPAMMALLAAPLSATDTPERLPGGWRLDWADEFDGSKLDTKKWRHELGVIRNQDAVQTYTKDCVKVRGGRLILISKARETKNSNYDPKKKHWTNQRKTMPYASYPRRHPRCHHCQ